MDRKRPPGASECSRDLIKPIENRHPRKGCETIDFDGLGNPAPGAREAHEVRQGLVVLPEVADERVVPHLRATESDTSICGVERALIPLAQQCPDVIALILNSPAIISTVPSALGSDKRTRLNKALVCGAQHVAPSGLWSSVGGG